MLTSEFVNKVDILACLFYEILPHETMSLTTAIQFLVCIALLNCVTLGLLLKEDASKVNSL